jgi:peptidoglycan hydrolase-like protein with peptidoglycan-binding domain
MLVFLGYSTASSGAFLIDGDFGRGTNRGVAQFQFEHGLGTTAADRGSLCYSCTYQTARRKITIIPETTFDLPTMQRMLKVALNSIELNEVTFADFDEALFHLNSVHQRRHLNCQEIYERYGKVVDEVVAMLQRERNVAIQAEWILSIIRQETSGIVRPRFEQHKLSAENRTHPNADFAELRYRSMSIGLGQIMGFNYKRVGAPTARAMLFSPVRDQVLYVARFIARKKQIVVKANPTIDDFRVMARFYNGPAYESHFYHERLQTWFREFRALR